MQVLKDHVVTFHYSLKNEQGEQLETSRGEEPMAYLHGHGNIIAGLERGIEGKNPEDIFSVTVTPEDGYGERREDAIQRVPIKHLMLEGKGKPKLKPGMVVSINTEDGPRQVLVVKAGKFNVDVDNNHPLAGKTLIFDVEIISIREATEEELRHGHAHGVGGHQH